MSTTALPVFLELNALRSATVQMDMDVIQQQENVFVNLDTMEKLAPISVRKANSDTNAPRIVQNVAPALPVTI